MENILSVLKNIGLSDKAAKVYLASLELGEATVQELAEKAGLKRTTVYYTIEELVAAGALIETERRRKTLYIAEPPARLLKIVEERMKEFENYVPILESQKSAAPSRPRVYFLYGASGFKQAWEKIFDSGEKEYCIITQGENFLDFVKEKYITDAIIRKKKKLGIRSRQLICDSPYARDILAKDPQENRTSKILPPRSQFPFTQIICGSLAIFISPRFENMLFIVENASFARTQRVLFDLVWNSLPEKAG
jgi:sugar-specific transcriptional regulator TrmB